MAREDILLEIDETLDQLIHNAEAIDGVDMSTLSEVELDAFQKTQESLLHHLLHMDEVLVSQRNALKVPHKRLAGSLIQEKLNRFEKMKSSYQKTIAGAKKKTPILSKRRCKKVLCFR